MLLGILESTDEEISKIYKRNHQKKQTQTHTQHQHATEDHRVLVAFMGAYKGVVGEDLKLEDAEVGAYTDVRDGQDAYQL